MNTKYFLNLVAGNVFQSQTTPAIPTEYYIGLSTTTPNINGSNVNEPPASGSYQRIKLTNLSAPTDGVITNNADISWPESTSDWGVVTSYVIYDSATVGAGNLLAEIHETSDITYRVYDFDRRDADGNLRQLHTEEAKDAIGT